MTKSANNNDKETNVKYAIGWTLFLLLAVFGIGWAAQGNDFLLVKVFAPKYEQVRHDTFKQSQAFNDGMAQQLDQAMVDYARAASAEQRQAVGSVVMHQFAGYDESKLTADERRFLDKVRAEQMGVSP